MGIEKGNDSLENQAVAKRPRHLFTRFYRRFGTIFTLATLLGIGSVAAHLGWQIVKSASYFSIQKIEVSGVLTQVTPAQIVQAAGVKLGTNLFQVSLNTVSQNILKFEWVASVSVRRQVPSTLWIHVVEQKPVALLLAGDLYFVSPEGKLFKKVEMETPRDLLVVTGFEKEESLEPAMRLIHFLKDFRDFDLFGISEIHYNEATGFSIVTVQGPMEIKLGHENFEKKLERWKKIWPTLQTQLGRVRGVDLDYEDKAFVKL